MTRMTYDRSPSVGAHWLVEAGDLLVGTGIYWYRSATPGWVPEKGQDYYHRFALKIEDAGPALAAAYPDRKYEVAQHGSAFYVARAE